MPAPVPIPVLDLKAYDATTGMPKDKITEIIDTIREYLKTKTNMAGTSTNKTLLLDVYCSKTINDTEFLLLYDITLCSNLHLPYWKYDCFLLEDMNDDECKAEFRFLKEEPNEP